MTDMMQSADKDLNQLLNMLRYLKGKHEQNGKRNR